MYKQTLVLGLKVRLMGSQLNGSPVVAYKFPGFTVFQFIPQPSQKIKSQKVVKKSKSKINWYNKHLTNNRFKF